MLLNPVFNIDASVLTLNGIFSANSFWLDPNDMSTMWQDTAGTIPAVVNSRVARIDDKSGNGNNFINTDAAGQPFLRDNGTTKYLEFATFERLDSASGVLKTITNSVILAYQARRAQTGHLFSNSVGASLRFNAFKKLDNTQTMSMWLNGTEFLGSGDELSDNKAVYSFFNQSANQLRDGAVITTLTPGDITYPVGTHTFSISHRSGGAVSDAASGHFYGAIGVDYTLTGEALTLAQNELGSNLPADPTTVAEALINGGTWIDPDDLSTVWQDSAGTIAGAVDQPIGRIDDKSGNGNFLSQTNVSLQPVLRFDGAHYYVDNTGGGYLESQNGVLHFTHISAYIAYRPENSANNQQILNIPGTNGSTAGVRVMFAQISPATPAYVLNGSFVAGTGTMNNGVPAVFSIIPCQDRQYRDTTLIGNFTRREITYTNSTSLRMGAHGDGSEIAQGRFYGLVIANGLLSEVAEGVIQTFLGTKI